MTVGKDIFTHRNNFQSRVTTVCDLRSSVVTRDIFDFDPDLDTIVEIGIGERRQAERDAEATAYREGRRVELG